MTPDDLDVQVAALHGEGLGHRRIAEELGVTPYAVRRAVARLDLPPQPAGRPGEGRTVAVLVRLTPDEVAAIDAARGEVSRAEWLRTRALRT